MATCERFLAFICRTGRPFWHRGALTGSSWWCSPTPPVQTMVLSVHSSDSSAEETLEPAELCPEEPAEERASEPRWELEAARGRRFGSAAGPCGSGGPAPAFAA